MDLMSPDTDEAFELQVMGGEGSDLRRHAGESAESWAQCEGWRSGTRQIDEVEDALFIQV